MSRHTSYEDSYGRSSRGQSSHNPITHQEQSYSQSQHSSHHSSKDYSRPYGGHSATRDSHSTSHSTSHYASQDHDRGYGSQMQAQEHIFRSAQASKQMVYDVYGNAITMLEELEHREMKDQGTKSLARSDIHLPSQSAHDTDTIKRKLDTQLLLLESQLKSCDKGILSDVKEDLKGKTLDWASQRQVKGVKKGKTDKYAGKLFEVLEKGNTNHPDEFYKTPSISERDMQKSIGAYVHGTHIRHNLDSDFKNNPNKKAVAPRIREGAGTEYGAQRMLEVRPDMKTAINKYRPYDNK